jgi:hypothetical protein
MSIPNPYQSPPVVGPPADRILVRNYNYAGGELAMVLVIGPLLIAGMVWLIVNGRMRDTPLSGQIIILAMMVLAELAGLVLALRNSTLWIELGPTIRYGSLIMAHEVEWSDVQRLWFDRDDKYVGVWPARVTLELRHILVIEISDSKDLRVHVPSKKLSILEAMLSRHPRFRTLAELQHEVREAEAQTVAELDRPSDEDDEEDEDEDEDEDGDEWEERSEALR